MFARRFPAHLLPGLEFAIDQYLRGATRNLRAPEDFEVVILPVAHTRSGEGDETPIVEVDRDDQG